MATPEPDGILARRKRPAEKFRIGYDFSDGDLETNDVLAPASEVRAYRRSDGVETTATMISQKTMSDKVLAAAISGGEVHEEYDVCFSAVTTGGDTFVRYVRVSMGPEIP